MSEESKHMQSRKQLVLLAFLLTAIGATNLFAVSASSINLPEETTNLIFDDDYTPDVTARVARISFISGEAQIRRADGQDWEKVTLNLPIVEGDEVATSAGSRVEIQFNTNTHLRLTENSYLKVSKLKDEGIAISLPSGTMSVRLVSFDKDRAYFEMDAPNTTIAVQRSGMYRLDAGRQGDNDIRISALDNGEARVYSDTSGFTLKNGRSSRIYIAGANAGEWDTTDAARYADNFDTWALERDMVIAKQLKNAHYDKYYDQDIYAADELNDNGQWIQTRKYGNVWRPNSSSISRYADWSPYRYGTWRWVPPFGWTWVNDEPWGWATYHHGRWVWDAGYWNWSPYGNTRYSRSWWSPALVVFTTYAGNYCWYPLPYSYNYYNYNYYYFNNNHHGNGGHQNNNNGGGLPAPTPNQQIAKIRRLPIEDIPVGGVITIKNDKFGTKLNGATVMDATIARSLLTRIPVESESAPIFPDVAKVRNTIGREIKAAQPQIAIRSEVVKTGATTRNGDAPLDNELRNTRIFNGRKPVETSMPPVKATGEAVTSTPIRQTGAVERDTTVRTTTPIRQPVTPRYEVDRDETSRPPVKQAPTYTAPQNTGRETTRPPVKQAPTYDPPPQNTQRETPRSQPQQVREQPTQRETPKSQPAPVKESPKEQPKASPPSNDGRKIEKDDGR